MRANQQYDQGLSQVKNTYASVFNKPVTNPENAQRQREYAQQAQNQMKDISATDLSDPKNVKIAEDIMTPYLNDNDIAYDQSLTAYTNNQFQAAESDRLSKDEKVRTSFNPYSVNKLQWVINDLKTAKRGDGSIQNIEKRSYTPQLDINGYVDTADKAEGYTGIDYETPDGKAGIIKEHDGIRAVPAFTTRLNAIIDARFNPQFSDQGYDLYRREKAQVLQSNPGMSETDINRELGNRVAYNLTRMYENKVVSLQNDMKAKFDDPISMIMNTAQTQQNGKLTSDQQASIARLNAQKQGYVGAVQSAQDDYDQFIKNADKTIADVQQNPQDYYTRQVRETTINNMAKGRALGDYKYSLDVNKAWQALDNRDQWKTTANLRNAELVESARATNLAHEDRHEKNMIDAGWTIDASGKIVPPASTTMTDTHYLGENTTDPQHTSFTQELQQEKDNNLSTAVENTFSVTGVTGALLMNSKEGGLGLPLSTLTDFNTMYKRLYSNNNANDPNFKQTPAEQKAFNEVYDKLKGALGDEKLPRTYVGVRDAIYTYVANQNAKRVATGTFTSTNDPLANAFAASEISKDALNNYNSMVQQEQDWIKHMAISDKNKYGKLLNDSGNGLVTVNDIAKYAPTLEVSDGKTTRTISPVEYAHAYLDKSLQYVDGSTVTIGNKTYTINKVNGTDNIKSLPDSPYQHTEYPFDSASSIVAKRFGMYEDRDNLNKSLAENAASNLKFVKDKTGKIGGEFSYNFGNEKNPGRGEKIIAETTLPSNTLKWYDATTGKDITTDPDFKEQLKERTSSYSDIRKNTGEPVHSTVSNYGAPTTTFTLKSYTDENGKVQPARTIVAIQSPNARGEVISTTPQNSGLYVYQKLLKGESITSDNSSNACGFKYELQPNDRQHPTQVNVSITRKMYNPATKNIEDYTYPIKTLPLSSGIDNIMTEVRAMQVKSIKDLAADQKKYNLQNAR